MSTTLAPHVLLRSYPQQTTHPRRFEITVEMGYWVVANQKQGSTLRRSDNGPPIQALLRRVRLIVCSKRTKRDEENTIKNTKNPKPLYLLRWLLLTIGPNNTDRLHCMIH